MAASSGYLRFPHSVGDQLVFTAENEVWLVGLGGGRASRLTADSAPVSKPKLSPDGTLLAWVSRRAGEPEVFVMPTEGGPARQLTFFGHPGTTIDGFASDGRLIVLSAGSQPFRSRTWAYAVETSADGSAPERLPYGPIAAVAQHRGGATIVATGYLRDYSWWKRYRGGTATRLWLDPSGAGDFRPVLEEVAGPKTHPTWVGDRLAFLADFEGHGNVYSAAFSLPTEGVAPADPVWTDLRRHTDHENFYARQLSAAGSDSLVYQHAGQLWRLDDAFAADGSGAQARSRPLEITLPGPRAGRAPAPVDPAAHLGGLAVSQTGRASAVDIRGSIVWLTHRDGPARVIASQPGVRHRLPVTLRAPAPAGSVSAADAGPDHPIVAYITDAEGEDAVEFADADGTARRYGAGELGRVLNLAASPDGRWVAVATHDGRVLTVAAADGRVRLLEASPLGDASGLCFSPDSRWLAFSAAGTVENLRSIRLVELATGSAHSVTESRFFDSSPAFSADGKYLMFLSARTFDPVYDAHVFDLAFPLATRPYLVTLAADTPSPFEPELLGRPETPTPVEAPAAPAAAAPLAPSVSDEPTPPIGVDLDGLQRRVTPFPVPAGRLRELSAVRDGVIWLNAPVIGELGESREAETDVRASLQRWDFGQRELTVLAEHVDRVAISTDGSRLLVLDHDQLTVRPAERKPAEDDARPVDLSRVNLEVDPPAEWAQMVSETGRLMRDHYWIEDMADLDWDSSVAKYLPLVDQLGSREDLSDLLWELNGETGSSHAYETPRPSPSPEPRRPAFLGADLSPQPGGGWVIDRIVDGDNSARAARSPLQAPGVRAQPGDVLIGVNGRPLTVDGPAAALRGTAGKPVEPRLSRAGVEHSTVVIPLASDSELRYLDWVASRRIQVHQATEGRVGYLHIPDMVSNGWAAFHRDLSVEIARPALIVDVRDNGGHTSQLVVEKLARRVVGRVVSRHHAPSSYPEQSPQGPLVFLANEWAGSDGDIVNAAVQSLGLGPVLGVRTWGGVIGIDGRYDLIDGTSVTQPRYAFWFAKFGWAVENHGIDPDEVVEFPPQAWAQDADPQLAAGISRVLAALDAAPPPPQPDASGRPSRRPPPLPPRS